MAKTTYYLGAGASFNSIPILNRLSEIMIEVAVLELTEITPTGGGDMPYKFDPNELTELPDDNRIKILWYIGFFGKKGILFNTIDTYARKLELTKDVMQLDTLKMCISVFFDLWENFHESRYSHLFRDEENGINYMGIDYRYKSLFSILLQNNGDRIQLNEDVKFITWNYDLQLESTFRLFLEENSVDNFEELNSKYLQFKEDNDKLTSNNIFHLNGHRGFHSNFDFKTLKKSPVEPNTKLSIEHFWKSIEGLFDNTMAQNSNFNQYIKYAWEHEEGSKWINEISEVLSNTDILVIIGYSFPPFNREIDQLLFSKLNKSKIKKIIYQDPNARKQVIENLFINPNPFKAKIEIQNNYVSQFHLPNEYFISQKPLGAYSVH
jgi:hypothetical protein